MLDDFHASSLSAEKVQLNNLLGSEEESSCDTLDHTKGKDLSMEQMSAVQAITAISWCGGGGTRHISQFMLLGLQVLTMLCWSHSTRTVLSLKMRGLSTETA